MSLVSAAGGRNTRSSRSQPTKPSATQTNANASAFTENLVGDRALSPALRQPEHIERSSLGGVLRQVAHGIDEAAAGGRVARIELVRHDRAGPTADTGQDRDVLAPVRTAIGRGLPDDPRTGLEPPQQLAGAGMHRFEPA